MDRRTFITSMTGGLLAAPLAAEAQSAKVPLIGILSPPEPFTALDTFRSGLRDLGYTDPGGIRLEYRSSEGHDERFPALAADLVGLKVDAIIAATVPAIRPR